MAGRIPIQGPQSNAGLMMGGFQGLGQGLMGVGESLQQGGYGGLSAFEAWEARIKAGELDPGAAALAVKLGLPADTPAAVLNQAVERELTGPVDPDTGLAGLSYGERIGAHAASFVNPYPKPETPPVPTTQRELIALREMHKGRQDLRTKQTEMLSERAKVREQEEARERRNAAQVAGAEARTRIMAEGLPEQRRATAAGEPIRAKAAQTAADAAMLRARKWQPSQSESNLRIRALKSEMDSIDKQIGILEQNIRSSRANAAQSYIPAQREEAKRNIAEDERRLQELWKKREFLNDQLMRARGYPPAGPQGPSAGPMSPRRGTNFYQQGMPSEFQLDSIRSVRPMPMEDMPGEEDYGATPEDEAAELDAVFAGE